MISLGVNNIGSFMSKLLSSECFDSFLLEEATIRMAVTYSIDGHLNKDFYEEDVWNDANERPYDYQPWSELRDRCRAVIKGSRAPIFFQFTLRLKPEFVPSTLKEVDEQATIDAISALAMNIRLENNQLHVVSGVSMKTFTLDKSADKIWDNTVKKFLTSKGIEYEENT